MTMADRNVSQQTTVQYKEFVIEKKDFKPVFVWNKIKSSSLYGNDRQVPSIILNGKVDGEDAVITLQEKPFSRFLQFMNIGKRRFMNMMYEKSVVSTYNGQRIKKSYIGSEIAQQALESAYPKVSVQKFKILLANNKVARITSEDYIGIPHSFVQEVIENRMDAEGVQYTKATKFGGVNGVYTFTNIEGASLNGLKKVGDLAHSISYMNRNSGDKSLKLFGGAVVLVCTNGMTSGKATSEMRIVHKLEMSELRKKIEQQLGGILEKLRILPKEFLKLREYKVTKEEAEVLVNALPLAKYLKDAIWARLFTPSKQTRNGEMDWDGTMWGIYMASTFIASNQVEVQKSRHSMKEVNEEIVERLSNVDTFRDVWANREKILEEAKAPKVEVTN